MIETLLVILLIGFLISIRKDFGLFNPFQIYFFVWFIVFLFYFTNSDAYIRLSNYFLATLVVVNLVAILICYIVCPLNACKKNHVIVCTEDIRQALIYCLIILVFISIPFAYQRALILSKGEDIFSIYGYIILRSAFTEDAESFGVFSRFALLSLVLTTVQLIFIKKNYLSIALTIISVINAIFYIYVGTGRTYIILLACLIFISQSMNQKIKIRGLLSLIFISIVMIFILSAMTTKGIDFEKSFSENLTFMWEYMRGYITAPIVAFSTIFDSEYSLSYGLNSLRSIIAILYSTGISTLEPIILVRDYVFVPEPTNVYTVYEPYLFDFGYIGLCVPPLFLIIHQKLYRLAQLRGGRWVYIYAASVYPLVMQFFQDQYFSLLSMWIQIVFWFFLLIPSSRKIPNQNLIFKND